MTGGKSFFHAWPDGEFCLFYGLEQNFPPHFHDHCAAGFLLRGRRSIAIGGTIYTIEPLDLVVFPPHVIHSCISASSLPAIWVCAHFYDTPERGVPNLCKRHCVTRQGASAIATLLPANMASSIQNSRQIYFMLREQAIKHMLKNGLHDEVASPKMSLVKNLCLHLASNIGGSFSLEAMGKLVGMDKFSLTRLFNNTMGVSPYRYFENLRMNLAAKMLKNGVGIAESAQAAGFYDQSHFSKFFKTNTGLTPGFYRTECAKNTHGSDGQ